MDETAKQQVEAFIDLMQRRYGLSESDIQGAVQQLVMLQRRSEFARKMGEWTAKTIIVVLVSAFFSGLAWAIVHFVKDLKA